MAYIIQKGGRNSNYYIIDKEQGRIIYSRSTKTNIERIAYKKLNEYIDAKERGLKEIYFTEYLAKFEKDYIACSKPVMQSYTRIARRFVEFCNNRPLAKYSTYDIDSYIAYILKNTSPHTAHGYRRAMHTLFETAVNWDFCIKNPVKRSKIIKLPEPDIKFFTKEQFKMLINTIEIYRNRDTSKLFNTDECRQMYIDLFTFLVLSGLRFNELQHLKPHQIDLQSKLIHIVSDAHHKTKTGRSRYVELNALLVPIVKRYRRNEYMFTGNGAGDKLNLVWINKVLKKYLRIAGLDGRLNIKAMRSTFGMWLLEQTGNIKYVSQQLGHSSVRTTEKHYAKYITNKFTGLNKIVI